MHRVDKQLNALTFQVTVVSLMSAGKQIAKEIDVRFPSERLMLGRPVAPLLLLLILVSLATVSALVFDTFGTLDRLGREHLYQQVSSAIDVETHRQEQLLQEYAYWDEGYRLLIAEHDAEWADKNLGTFVAEDYGLDLAVVFRGDGSIAGAWVNGERLGLERLPAEEVDLARLAERLRASEAIARSAFIRFQDNPYLVSAEQFRDEETEQARPDGSLLLFGRALTDSLFADWSETYGLPNLGRVGEHSAADLVLRNDQEYELVRLLWDKDTPATVYLHRLLLPIVLVFALMAGLGWWMLDRERDNRTRYIRQLFEMASKDFLTGISNRREFFFLANREMTRANREDKPLSVLMMDLDWFKKINDTLGHDAGDEVLSGFARLVKSNLRDFDIFARLGGEEFVVLLVGSGRAEALETAERICHLVEQHAFQVAQQPPANCTVSIGLAVWNHGEAIDRLLNRADDALYEAKANGRNQVAVAEFS